MAAPLTTPQTPFPYEYPVTHQPQRPDRRLVALLFPPISLPLPPIPSHPRHPVSQHCLRSCGCLSQPLYHPPNTHDSLLPYRKLQPNTSHKQETKKNDPTVLCITNQPSKASKHPPRREKAQKRDTTREEGREGKQADQQAMLCRAMPCHAISIAIITKSVKINPNSNSSVVVVAVRETRANNTNSRKQNPGGGGWRVKK